MIKFSHTVFALPFALTAVVLAWRRHPVEFLDILWILAAMAGARSAAMGFNRIADLRFDARNPRTRSRELPSGAVSKSSAVFFIAASSALFVFAAAMLSRLCFYLSFPVLAVLFSYSYTKRFTWAAHLYLGFAISLAPLGAWIALAKSFYPPILFLSLALMTYIAGFDILYACQDIDFDQSEGLHSIPARFGLGPALHLAAAVHLISFCCFIAVHVWFDMSSVFLGAVLIIGLLYLIEHRMVKPNDLTRIPVAFFHVNSIVSVVLFAGVIADELVRRNVIP